MRLTKGHYISSDTIPVLFLIHGYPQSEWNVTK